MTITCKIDMPEAVRRGFNVTDKMDVEIDITTLSFRERDVLSANLMAQNFKNPKTHLWTPIPAPTAKGLREVLGNMLRDNEVKLQEGGAK